MAIHPVVFDGISDDGDGYVTSAPAGADTSAVLTLPPIHILHILRYLSSGRGLGPHIAARMFLQSNCNGKQANSV